MLPGPCNKRIDFLFFFFFPHQNKCQKVLWREASFFKWKELLWARFWWCWKPRQAPLLQKQCMQGHTHPKGPSGHLCPQGCCLVLVCTFPTALTLNGRRSSRRWSSLRSMLGPCCKSSFLGKMFLPLKSIYVALVICLNRNFPRNFLDTENPNAVQLFQSGVVWFLNIHTGPYGFPYKPGMQNK